MPKKVKRGTKKKQASHGGARRVKKVCKDFIPRAEPLQSSLAELIRATITESKDRIGSPSEFLIQVLISCIENRIKQNPNLFMGSEEMLDMLERQFIIWENAYHEERIRPRITWITEHIWKENSWEKK